MTQDAKRKEKNNDKNTEAQHRTRTTVTIIGLAGLMIAAFAGIMSLILRSARGTPIPASDSGMSGLIFSDTFDNNNAKWFVDQTERDFNSSGLRAITYIENGKYYRQVESNDSFSRIYSVIPIPNVSIDNFCLVFDSRVFDSPQDASIDIIVRATAWQSYYYIGFNTDGKGYIRLMDRQLAKWENGVSWTDEKTHTVKISFQNDTLEIYDGQANTLLYKTTLTGDDFLSDLGDIRIGLELFNPNQKATAEIDNVLIYNKCP